MRNTSLPEQLAGLVGIESFNKFLRSLPKARDKGRLFEWQERFIANARNAGVLVPSQLPDLLAALADAPTLKFALTQQEFAADPFKYWGHRDYEVPSAWLDGVVSNPEVREDLFYALARSASKVGDFNLATEALATLSRTLSPNEAVDLYCYIRDTSERLEEEWRPGFEDAFPAAVALLPAIQVWLSDLEPLS